MSIVSQFRIIDDSDKNKAVENLVTNSTPDYDFFILVFLSVSMAALGLILNSASVVIGSMLIAPILYPVLGMSAGLVMGDYRMMRRSGLALGKSVIIGIAVAAAVTFLFNSGRGVDVGSLSEVMERGNGANFIHVLVAVLSGTAVSYALAKPKLNETLPGIALSVALVPPIATIGIGIAEFEFKIAAGAFGLFFANILGIVLSSMVIFALMGFQTKSFVADVAIEKEKERIEEEEKEREEVEKDLEVEMTVGKEKAQSMNEREKEKIISELEKSKIKFD